MKLSQAGAEHGQGRFDRGAPTAKSRWGVSAYTMAEMLVAVLILATMVISLYGGFTASFAIVRANRDELHATQLLTRQVEALRLCAWKQLSNFSLQDHYDPVGGVDSTGGTIFGVTVCTNAPESIPDGAPYKNEMRLVTVTVSWTNFNGDTPIVHSRQVQTHTARYGLQNYSWGAFP